MNMFDVGPYSTPAVTGENAMDIWYMDLPTLPDIPQYYMKWIIGSPQSDSGILPQLNDTVKSLIKQLLL